MLISYSRTLKHSRIARALAFGILIASAALLGLRHLAAESGYDLLIINGRIIDGSGSPWFEGSVAVKDGKIAAVGRLPNAAAQRVIDAGGLIICPGFIDLHSHSDYTLLVDGKAESKIRQGVTTEILGESESAGPILGPAVPEFDKEMTRYGLTRDWTTLGEYLARVARQGSSVNIASYVGSGQVRMDVMGNVNRAPSPEEMERIKALVDQAMREGALGLSSGLIYPPNSFATTAELIALAEVAARYGGIYTSHIRGEGDHWKRAVDEAIEIGEKARLPVHILHFKIDGRSNWGQMAQQVSEVQAARDRGVDITVDQYPYIASMTGLEMCVPPKYLEGSSYQVVARLKDSKVRAEIRQAIADGLPGWESNQVKSVGGWHGVLVASLQKPENKQYEGRRMDEVAKKMGKDPLDALCDLLVSEGGSAEAVYFSMSEPDVELAMKQPWLGVGSDGSAVSPAMAFIGKPHPRFYGTFPRVLAVYVRERKVLSLPDAVRKMTSFPAQICGLMDRGLLRPGMAADITVFDPKAVADQATFQNPLLYPVGIPYVIVNGVVVIDQGQHTGEKTGRVLYGRGKL
ncbi:N-acyl-D-aspartate/D-glutamate deacylase [Acidobacteriia bacterium SbA2]|nr:N-acyl-D-aspartate/D-glutamate deacylase [Acidobacteriia bacterium SbA2]